MKFAKKTLSATILSAILFLTVTSTAASSGGCGWYVKRNGNHRPGFPADAEAVSENGGYYIDKSITDDSDTKRIYLTFDVGYENGNVSKILDVMRDEEVVGAFFILKNLISKNPELVRRMKSEGHLVCNHTAHHKDLTVCDRYTIERELTELATAYRDLISEDMPRYFRFPEGKYSIDAVKSVSALGYKSIFWSFGYEDWDNSKQPSEGYAIQKILQNTHNGAVILLHPTSATNAAIMRTLIREWRAMGYYFGTLDELTSEL
jgi:peptidoglycan-N-acetylmuramic acid deacetylase